MINLPGHFVDIVTVESYQRCEERAAIDRNRHRGALFGLAAGDAVGTTLEFRQPGTFQPIDDMVGGGPFGLAPG